MTSMTEGGSMLEWEAAVRLACFAVAFAVLAAWEAISPWRPLSVRRPLRWMSNLGLVALNTVAVRLVIAVTAAGAALLCEEQHWGLLHQVAWPAWVETVLAVLVFDLVIYLQHVMFHAVPALWRLHLVHHADLDLDVTTGLRFHTLEILLSL